MKSKLCIAAGFIALVMCVVTARALINPNFTPLNLVSESKLIATVDMQKGDKPDIYVAKVEVLKGDKSKKTMTFDFSTAPKEKKEYFVGLLEKGRPHPALIFTGKFSDASRQTPVQPGEDAEADGAFLHLGGKWIDLSAAGSDKWSLMIDDAHMEGTWAGSSDMLLKAVKYTLADSTADFPVKSGAQWQAPVKIGKVEGVVYVRPVDVAGNGKQVLFVMSGKGDHLFAYDAGAKALKDVTQSKKLASKSSSAVWGDFNGDGTLDLASFDGKALTVHSQQADGTFKAEPVALAADAAAACRLMGIVDAKGKAGLVLAGGAAPLIVKDVLAKEPKAEPLAEAGATLAGKVVDLLLADFTGDYLPDVMCIGEKGSLLFKGKEGGFAPAVACAVCTGPTGRKTCTADFDADGRLDVFTTSEGGQLIWQNEGDGKFSEFIGLSGEIAYIAKPNGNDCQVCDVNNDGKQDILMTYEADNNVHIFFNRGFRSFGHAHDLDLSENSFLDNATAGQKSGCIADFNDDGAQDMVVALPDGELNVLYRSIEEGMTLALAASLPVKNVYKGPALLTGWMGERCLGAWNIVPGTAGAFIGTRDAGQLTVKWQLPGGPAQKQIKTVENKVVKFEIK